MARWRTASGLLAVALCIGISSLWSVWGAIENFHEGWYFRTLFQNLILAFVQYLAFPLGFAVFSTIGVFKPRLGAFLFLFVGILVNAALFSFRNSAGIVLILAPCVIFAVLFGLGTIPKPRVLALLTLGIPLAIIVAISVPLGWKVSHRLTTLSKAALIWPTGQNTLVWAPPGPGWPDFGVTYEDAVRTCSHLSADGKMLSSTASNVWRLPTVSETVRSLNRGGAPAGCTYSGSPGFQSCQLEPDKEAPLWDPYSQVIYWWSATDDAKGNNLRVSYNGYVLPVKKTPTGYTSFRAVRDPFPGEAVGRQP